MALEGLQLSHYHLIHQIGSGGMGEVYLAEDPRLHRQVAIKVIRAQATTYPGTLESQEAARLFQREARAIAMLDHPYILSLFDYGEEKVGGMVYTFLVMPFRQEGSLANWLYQRGSWLNLDDAGHFIQQAASALQYAHNHAIIHQDVKPPNFLIRSNPDNSARPDLLLTDFGVAKLSTATSNISHNVRGTPTYMAPEQWNGNPVPATDQYALAIMAYEMLAGRPPFQGPPMRIMYLHASEPPQPPSTLNPRIPSEVDAVLLKALAKNPQDRFTSISAFAQALQQALQTADGPTILKNPITPPPFNNSLPEAVLRPDSGGIARTLPASNPGRLSSIPLTPHTAGTETAPRRQGFLTGRTLVLIGLALLVVLASVGIFLFNESRVNTNANNSNVVATTQARDATTFAAQGTLQADHTTATAQAITTATTITHSNATATVVSGNPETYPPYNWKLALFDPLKDNTAGYNWDMKLTQYGTCSFINGAFHVVSPTSPYYHSCAAQNTNFSNFAYEVEVTIISGNCGAIIFRANVSLHQYYFFRICQDGSYQFLLYTQTGYATNTFIKDSSPYIHSGLGNLNLIAVVANNNTFALYINHQLINSVQDSTYSQGQIGLVADNDNSPTEVAFSNAKVWIP
ncbi:MAG TPA: serine/threonine-protein kinase [Ktedonobacteraceae bacterium]